jgi:ATP-binding cassette subfamily B protein
VFEQLHRLSLSYYTQHEAGELMSRITNDTTAIEQAISFALVNVISGILLLVWVAYNMLAASFPFAVLSLSVSPLMFIATLWFARGRAAAGDRQCIAEPQETISSSRSPGFDRR